MRARATTFATRIVVVGLMAKATAGLLASAPCSQGPPSSPWSPRSRRHLQRRLPRALAAGEPPVAVRRRHRLGRHAV